MSAQEVLRAFRCQAPYIFLGAAFTAIGLISGAFAVLRENEIPSSSSAPFAALYGLSPLDLVTPGCDDGRQWSGKQDDDLTVSFATKFQE